MAKGIVECPICHWQYGEKGKHSCEVSLAHGRGVQKKPEWRELIDRMRAAHEKESG